jgi:YD repeat-containing protein
LARSQAVGSGCGQAYRSRARVKTWRVDYAYGKLGRLTKHTCPDEFGLTFDYDENSNRTQETFSDRSYRRYTYSVHSVDCLEAGNVYDSAAELEHVLDLRHDLAGNEYDEANELMEVGKVGEPVVGWADSVAGSPQGTCGSV